jgi:choline dehydrogenase-like flavoprotein
MRGRRVHMVDAGVRLETERAEIANNLSKSLPDLWSPEHLQLFTEGIGRDVKGIPVKLKFGSDYPYQDADSHLGVVNNGVAPGLSSLAFGGLSTVWGAAMLPYIPRDIADWPISSQQLSSHYAAVLKLTGLSADYDDLTELLPLFTESSGYLLPSRQASSMWRTLCRHRSKLQETGIRYGRARLAIKAAREPQDSGCVYCGMCMHGCPYGYIYSSEQTVRQFQQHQHFSYQTDLVVTTVEEAPNQVIVRGYHRVTRQPMEVEAERVYLAAGAVSTTGILLRSMRVYERWIRMKYSQRFMLPLILTARIPNVREERLHTLSQIFLEILDPEISQYSIHLQVYSYNSLVGTAVRRSMSPLSSILEFLAREIEGRLMVILGYIHSAQSGGIAMMLEGGPVKETLQLTPIINPETKRIVHKVVRKLLKNSFRLGAVPLLPLLNIGQIGSGNHVGGTFPMRKEPRDFETDIWGRPGGWQRIHAVDATILPSIATTTITLPVMANAHRIALEFDIDKNNADPSS